MVRMVPGDRNGATDGSHFSLFRSRVEALIRSAAEVVSTFCSTDWGSYTYVVTKTGPDGDP